MRPAPDANKHDVRGAGCLGVRRHDAALKVLLPEDLGHRSTLVQANGLKKRRHAAALQGALRALFLRALSNNYAAFGVPPTKAMQLAQPNENAGVTRALPSGAKLASYSHASSGAPQAHWSLFSRSDTIRHFFEIYSRKVKRH